MRPVEEGGNNAPSGVGRAEAPRVAINPEDLYYNGKSGFDAYIGLLRSVNPALAQTAQDYLQNTKDASTREVAQWFRKLSDTVWSTNSLWALFGLSQSGSQIPIQEMFNHRLWSQGLSHIRSDEFLDLFPAEKSENWPNLVLTVNHARAWKGDDLRELQAGIHSLMRDAWGAAPESVDISQSTAAADVHSKTIQALACYTDRDIFLNGARLIDRRLDLEEDPNADNPAQRTLSHMSPASMRLAKLILKLMVVPEHQEVINLDRPYSHEKPDSSENPFVADGEYIKYADKITLRGDSARIAQHIKLVGYSLGANTVTDALRFFYQELDRLGPKLHIEDGKGSARAATPSDIRTIISNMGVLNINPGEVPLTKAERETLGIQRTTILNRHDMTAGHLVNPNHDRYDPWSDTLIEINGTTADAGHNIVEALGSNSRAGYIMDKARAAGDAEYEDAQDTIKAFFASNFHKHAITTLCLAHDNTRGLNELYVQFAPGISRADEGKLQTELLDVLKAHGFPQARAESDLVYRRRIQIVLDESPSPIETSQLKLEHLRDAFAELQSREEGQLFVVRRAQRYFDDLIAKATPYNTVADVTPAALIATKGMGGR